MFPPQSSTRAYLVHFSIPPKLLLTSPIRLFGTSPFLPRTFFLLSTFQLSTLSPPPPLSLPLLATKPPTSLGQGPFQHILSHKMSTATPDKAVAPKLEKKPVKFSNLLLGAGLNMFEVTTLGQVNTIPTPTFPQFHLGCFELASVKTKKQQPPSWRITAAIYHLPITRTNPTRC